MTTESETLEAAIQRAKLTGFTIQQVIGDEQFPYRLIGPAVTLDGLNEVLELIDTRTRKTDTLTAEPRDLGGHLRDTVNQLEHQIDEVTQELDRIADTIDPGTPAKGRDVRFDDEHYIILRGIVRAARDVFREINQPEEGGINRPAVEASCVLQALADQVEQALGERT